MMLYCMLAEMLRNGLKNMIRHQNSKEGVTLKFLVRHPLVLFTYPLLVLNVRKDSVFIYALERYSPVLVSILIVSP